ncbi:MAG TPA: Sip1-related alpha-galactosidase, partial [Alphaproteobacteria bacterium]|nr:Sip1-related alpha-galactosidase [Alphaproteobacteria bacterium]
MSNVENTGVIEKTIKDKKPDDRGIIESSLLLLPEYECGIYYCPVVEKQAIGNRFFGINFTDLDDLRNQRQKLKAHKPLPECDMGSFICLKINDRRYMALLAMASENAFSTFTLKDDGMHIVAGTFGTEELTGVLPGLAYAFGETPHEASLYAWETALNSKSVNHSTTLRWKKSFPEPFKYPGYCTWEHMRRNMNSEKLSDIMKEMTSCEIPFRWMLIDDGYENYNERNELISFAPNPEKFPDGFTPLAKQKSENGVRWLGLWWHMAGYFGGISPKHTIKKLDDKLFPLQETYLAPKSNQECANAFYESRARAMASDGIDFIKVDFQTQYFRNYIGQPNPIQSASYNHRGLEKAWSRHFKALMNCIAQHHLHVFKHQQSATIRSSIDYVKGDPENHAYVNLQSLRNSLYLGMTHWCDYDMFLSSLPTGKMMAEIRALTGSPFYVSEDMNKVDASCIKPAIWSDGELLRPLAPATLTPEGFFDDTDNLIVRAVSPLQGQVASFWLANLHNKADSEVTLSPDDYRFGGAMIQPYKGLWKQPPEGLIAFDWHEGKAWKMTQDFKTSLPRWKTKIVHLIPIQNGWSVIGRPDKYLSPAACRIADRSDKTIVVELKESGPFLIWSETGAPLT